MTAKTVHVASSGTKTGSHDVNRLPDSLGFVSTCPNCKDARFQPGYSFHGLVTFLVSSQPIEAYCAVCNEFWPISANDRAELAWLLLTA
jgi:hypothetical protein